MNQFLCHCLNIFDYHDYVTGTTRLKLNQSQLRKILISLPPLKEQKRIVVKVDELMKLCDELEEQLNQSKVESER